MASCCVPHQNHMDPVHCLRATDDKLNRIIMATWYNAGLLIDRAIIDKYEHVRKVGQLTHLDVADVRLYVTVVL